MDGVHFHGGVEHIIVFLGLEHAHLVRREVHGIGRIGDREDKLPWLTGDASFLSVGEAVLEVAMNGIQVAANSLHLEQKRIRESCLMVIEIFGPLASGFA